MVKVARKPPPPPLDANRAAAVLCRRGFAYFVREFWPVIIAEPMVWEPHMDVLCMEIEAVFRRLFQKTRMDPATGKPMKDAQGQEIKYRDAKQYDLVINIPPGTSKSTIVSVMAPVWGWINDPTLRFLTTSYAGRLSGEMAVKSRDIIRSPKFKLYFPEVRIKRDEDGKANYKTVEGGQRFATSIKGTATGQHAHCIIIDDPLNPKQAASQKELESANAAIDSTLNTRKVDKAVTVTITIMQRLGAKDPTGHLLSKNKGALLRHVNLPGELTRFVKPKALRAIYQDGLLSPLRMPRHVLQEMQVDMGSFGYAGQVLQAPAPISGGLWKKWFVVVPDEYMPAQHLLTRLGTHWDLAYTAKEENSASAYVTGGRLGSKIFITDLGWKWAEMPELIKWMKEKQAPHYIEAKASGKSAKQILSRGKVTAVEIPVLGGDKVARAQMALPVAESGVVYIAQSLVDRLYNDPKQGILVFPRGEHDDLADALAQFLQWMDGRNEIKEGNERRGRQHLLDEEPFDDIDALDY